NGDGKPDLAVAKNYWAQGPVFAYLGTVGVLLNTCDDESGPPPELTVVASDPNASETGPDPGTFTISRSAVTNSNLTVFFTVSGSATSGSDYQPVGDSVTIAAGAVSASVVVQPIDDTEVEGSETVVLTLSTNAAYVVSSSNSATVTIADNDAVA